MAVKKEKEFVIDNAELMAEWNWEKNNELSFDPKTLTLGNNKKLGGSVAKGTNGKRQLPTEPAETDARIVQAICF